MEIPETLSVDVNLQDQCQAESLPTLLEMKTWCEAAIQSQSFQRVFDDTLSVLIRVVDTDESAALNYKYRKKNAPTNVLTFANDVPMFMLDIAELKKENSHLGDLIICESLVHKEAAEQEKSVVSHWAHLIVHGLLHLQGFDHTDNTEAEEMEALEIKIMEQLGYLNPYIK